MKNFEKLVESLVLLMKSFVGLLDTPGGHILSGFILIEIGLRHGETSLVVAGSTIVGMGAKGLNGKSVATVNSDPPKEH